MGWNGSEKKGWPASRADSGRATSMTSPKKKGDAVALSKRPYWRGLLAGLLVIIGVGAALWWVASRERSQGAPQSDNNKSHQSQIAEAVSSVATNPLMVTEAAEAPVKKKPYRDSDGNLWIEKGRPYISPDAIVVHFPEREDPVVKIFKHGCDIQLAQMLCIVPGTRVEEETFGRAFDNSFTESIGDKIIIEPDDDDFTREIKQQVIDARKEIIARVKQGETPSQIMTEAWGELYALSRFKTNLEDQLTEISRSGDTTEADGEQLIAAADKMLEKKGLPPIKNKRLIMRTIKISSMRKKDEKGKTK